jgi:cation diffusion facilitator family transporter
MPDPEACRRCARAVPWASLWGNLGLAIYKVVVGTIGGSAALVADAAHSFADVVGSTGILVATKVSSREPNARFPYGTGKAEFLGAIFVYTVLFFFAGGIVVHAVTRMLYPDLAAPHFATLLGAIVSVVYNYVMFRYATCVGRRNNSPAILADAFENKADAISSVACIGGIFGAMYLHPICDPIAALGVGAVIFWNCQEQLREATAGLLDTGLSSKDVEYVKGMVLKHEAVLDVRFIRTRRTGARYWMDIGLHVPSDLPVDQADEVAMRIRDGLKRNPLCHHVEVFIFPTAPGLMPRLLGPGPIQPITSR